MFLGRHDREACRPRRARVRRFARAGLVAVLGAALFGCGNPLRPSEPELPSEEEGTVEVTPDYATPEGVLATIVDAIVARDRPGNGRAAYMGAFAGGSDGLTLTITFDPGVEQERVSAGKAIPTWTRSLEEQFYIYLSGLRGNLERSLTWSDWAGAPPDVIDDAGGTATIYAQYLAITIAEDGVTATSLAIGRATIGMRKLSASRWIITSWSDRIDPAAGENPTDAGLRSFSRLRIDSTGQ